ncbi:MAG: hypothetical protein KH828_00730 [Clostridiales bacterium]|nr:hypothetical protein [Clostridiales bacterium]
MLVADLLEALMILFFGLSWPISIRKSWVSRTAKGKSLFFEVFIWSGYIFGIARKFIQLSLATEPMGWLFYLGWFFYVLNLVEITIDMALYFRNVKLDKERDEAEKNK